MKTLFQNIKKLIMPDIKNEITAFDFDYHKCIKQDIIEKYNYAGDLLDIFAGNIGVPVHKWHHYIPIYDRYFS